MSNELRAVLRRTAVSAALAGVAGVGFAYLNEFLKDDPAWKFKHSVAPNFRVDFWATFVMAFIGSYLIQWWHREG